MSKPDIAYSLYLVTARELLPPGKVSGVPALVIVWQAAVSRVYFPLAYQDYYQSLEEVGGRSIRRSGCSGFTC